MNNKTKSFQLFLTACSLVAAPLMGDCCEGSGPKVCGKIDVGPAYVHIDLLQNGVTNEKMDIPAVRVDACYAIWRGVVIKPNFTYGYNNEELIMTGCGIGHIIPIYDCFKLTPVVGFNYSYLDTKTDIPFDDTKRSFQSYGGYIGIEGTYSLTKSLRLYATYQYVWTHNITSYKFPSPFSAASVRLKEHSSGSAISAMIEQDLNKYWSVNLAGAYNNSMSKEKNGMRAYGVKLGIARWF